MRWVRRLAVLLAVLAAAPAAAKRKKYPKPRTKHEAPAQKPKKTPTHKDLTKGGSAESYFSKEDCAIGYAREGRKCIKRQADWKAEAHDDAARLHLASDALAAKAKGHGAKAHEAKVAAAEAARRTAAKKGGRRGKRR